MHTAKASRGESSFRGKGSAPGCIPKLVLPRPDYAPHGGNQGPGAPGLGRQLHSQSVAPFVPRKRQLLATPWTAALQAPLSMGFSRQEYWSGVPLPSPQSLKSCPKICYLINCSSPGSSVHGIFQARILQWVAISLSKDLPDPGIEPTSPELAGRFFTTEPPGKPIWHLVAQ